MSERRPYRRAQIPLWWAKKPYRGYTIRELTGVGVALYALVLLGGVAALARGREAYESWLAFLASPCGLALHAFLLAVMLWHAVTWFQTLPKTQPKLFIGEKAVPQRTMTNAATLAAVLCWILVLLLYAWRMS
jgi:fumarate reductase subunit C